MESVKAMCQSSEKRVDLEETRRREEATKFDVRLKRAMGIMKGVLYSMPCDFTNLMIFFKNVEQFFTQYAIEPDLRSSLLNPYLNDRARKAVMNFSQEECKSYE